MTLIRLQPAQVVTPTVAETEAILRQGGRVTVESAMVGGGVSAATIRQAGHIQALSSVPGAASYPNEPAGAIPISGAVPFASRFDSFVATFPETDAQPFNWIDTPDWTSTATDATAPVHPEANGVGRVLVSQASTGGPPYGNPIQRFISGSKLVPPGGFTKVYVSLHIKYDSNCRMIANELKLWEYFDAVQGGWIISTRDGAAKVGGEPNNSLPPYRLHLYMWGGQVPENTSSATRPFTAGVWHHIEGVFDVVAKTVKLWLDETLHINVTMSTMSTQPSEIQAFLWNYGGSGPGLPDLDDPFYVWHDEMYISYTT